MKDVIRFVEENELNNDYQADIVYKKDPEFVFHTFTIEHPDTYDTTIVEEWINPGLKDVKSVLRIQVEYSACCMDVYSYYFLITKKDKLIELPRITYTLCDFPVDIKEYAFPGDGSSIALVNKHYNHTAVPDSSTHLKNYHWTGRNISEVKARKPDSAL